MVTVHRGWTCAITCEPTRPCFGPGCPNARQAYPFYNPGYGPPPSYSPGPNPYYNTNQPRFWRRWSAAPPRQPPRPAPQPQQPRPAPQPGPNSPAGTVRIGVGNVSNTDIEIDVRDNLVRGGRRRVNIGSDNYAARSNIGVIANNRADTDDLMIGVDNYSRGGDNNIRVRDNDFRGGFDRVRVGVGNYAGGSNRIEVGPDSGNRPSGGPGGPGAGRSWWPLPQQGGGGGRRWHWF